jgi:multidrug efflux system membrane fusion protein
MSNNTPKRWPRRLFVIAIFIMVFVGGAWYFFAHKKQAAPVVAARAQFQQVTVAPVGGLSPNNAPLSVIGTVSSQDDATILAPLAGEIVSLSKQLGDRVSAGEVIASMDNSSQSAALAQAQGAYAAAHAK